MCLNLPSYPEYKTHFEKQEVIIGSAIRRKSYIAEVEPKKKYRVKGVLEYQAFWRSTTPKKAR